MSLFIASFRERRLKWKFTTTGGSPPSATRDNELSTRNIKSEIKDAARVAKRINEYAEEQLDTVASGKSLKVQLRVFPESRFPKWATTLASMLCDKPDLANLTNKELAALIENEDGKSGLDSTTLSKTLTRAQRLYVGHILQDYGYAIDTLVKGTDIKRIIKNNIRIESENNKSTKFFSDSIEIDGTTYKYKLRRNPSGNRHTDFCIRMLGSDIPLLVVLKLRGIGINEFHTTDERACQFSLLEHTVNRPQPEEKPIHNKSLDKLIDYTAHREREVDPNYYTGTQVFEAMRTWYFGISPARQSMVSFIDCWNEMKKNQVFVDGLKNLVNKSEEAVTVQAHATYDPAPAENLLKGDYISDADGNLVDISTLLKSISSKASQTSDLLESV
jgi:hypothetical protein